MFLRSLFITIIAIITIFFVTKTINNRSEQKNSTIQIAANKLEKIQEKITTKSKLSNENTQVNLVKAGVYGLAAAHPFAVQAGMKILNQGGNAIDASIAVMAMLTLVEPQSSGLGGGSFMLYWDNNKKKLHAFDGREVAPQSATPDLFIKDGQPMQFYDAVVGGKSFGIPGILAMLKMAHDEFGQLKWQEDFQSAIVTSRQGFPLSQRLYTHITQKPLLKEIATSRNYFYDKQGNILPVGTIIKNEKYAQTLENIAKLGIDYLYDGPLADEIIDVIKNAKNPVTLSKSDFSNYKALKRQPVCDDYRGNKICSFSMPSSGGITMLNILNILENFSFANFSSPADPNFLHLYIEASRLAYADRAVYLADPDFLLSQTGFDPKLVTKGLISDEYAKERAKLINPLQALKHLKIGNPISTAKNLSPHTDYEPPSTSHFSIRDQYGNIVSMTATIESHFGNHYMAGGMFLNNELTDFSFTPQRNGKIVANSVTPQKRPRSSMSPAIIFDNNNQPFLAIGSPGGSNIIGYVTKAIIGILDFKLSVQEAIDLPNISTARSITALEINRFSDTQISKLQAMGHELTQRPLQSGLNGIIWNNKSENDYINGGSDKRSEGIFLTNTPAKKNSN